MGTTLNNYNESAKIQSIITYSLPFLNEKAITTGSELELTEKIFQMLATIIDAKDNYTYGHSKRVAVYSMVLGKEEGFGFKELDTLYRGALLHDIGKIGIADMILRKDSKLTDEEYRVIRQHPVIGYEILKELPSECIARMARHHHERYDGRGYPDGLVGDDIPFYARICSVADALDAMISDRPYRNKLSKKEVLEELYKAQGTQLDPELTDKMIHLLEKGKIKIK